MDPIQEIFDRLDDLERRMRAIEGTRPAQAPVPLIEIKPPEKETSE